LSIGTNRNLGQLTFRLNFLVYDERMALEQPFSDAEALRFVRMFCAACQEIAPKEEGYPLKVFPALEKLTYTHQDLAVWHEIGKVLPFQPLFLMLIYKRGLILLHSLSHIQIRGDWVILTDDFKGDRVDPLYEGILEIAGAYLAQVLPTYKPTMPPPKLSVLAM
jgi:hypothetical protein